MFGDERFMLGEGLVERLPDDALGFECGGMDFAGDELVVGEDHPAGRVEPA